MLSKRFFKSILVVTAVILLSSAFAIGAFDEGEECRIHADCDDGFWCNGEETCYNPGIIGTCQDGIPPDCSDDGFWCNGEEFCNEEIDDCDHDLIPECPDDGSWCNGEEYCNEDIDDCDHRNSPDCGDDGAFCNGTESCDEGIDDCTSSGDPCVAGETCNENTDDCDISGDDDDDDDCCGCQGSPDSEPTDLQLEYYAFKARQFMIDHPQMQEAAYELLVEKELFRLIPTKYKARVLDVMIDLEMITSKEANALK